MGWLRTSPRRWSALALTAVSLGTVAAVAPTAPASAAGPADHVLYWNDVLLRTYRQVGGAPGPLARAGAMVHGAIYDAANSALCATGTDRCLGQQYRIKVAPTAGVIPDLATAIDYAAYDTLRSVYPGINFDADLAAAQEGIVSSPARSDGQRMGSASAQAMISFRAGDGAPDTSTYADGTVPGQWRRTDTDPGRQAATPNWGLVKPFAMTSNTQFRPGPPAGFATYESLLGSDAYAAQVNEVKSLGAYDSTVRTADQTQAAWFWANDLDGTYKPPGQLFAHTRIASQSAKLTQAGNARLFGLVGIAMGDAAIVAWDAKYQTTVDLWRPQSAITLAGTDGNPATEPDADWKPLSIDENGLRFSPPFPAYASGHATFAGAWAGAMRGFFGTDDYQFTATTDDDQAEGVTRRFASFGSAATENARSRIYLGVHYQFDADAGLSSGTALADHVVANVLRPATSYTFDGFYAPGGTTPLGQVVYAAPPQSFTFEFALRNSAGQLVTDSGAVVGVSWHGYFGGTQSSLALPTFNASKGRFEVSASANRSCSGPQPFSVLLRDGSRHTITVDCDVV
ncbi:vanadium-dependent haloperoxidase [Micromonospora sp. NPDC047730]|uniref:vanadium-dependent haloperoxidase n=1 Tax=Micromonospora sp. NPDC047730 TaxID=3364253 RepID=UPI003724AAE2